MQLCDFGCGNIAIHYFSSTKRWCCAKSANSCPQNKKKNSIANKGKTKKYSKPHQPMLGKHPWNFSLTKETNVIVANIAEKTSQIRLGKPGHLQTDKTKQQISDTAKKNKKSGGYRLGAGHSNGCWYTTLNKRQVYFDSSWELAYAKFLDESNINWIRNTQKFEYQYQDETKNYIPDFYLPDSDVYIEIKGYIIDKDKYKWEALRNIHHKQLKVLTRKELTEMKLI